MEEGGHLAGSYTAPRWRRMSLRQLARDSAIAAAIGAAVGLLTSMGSGHVSAIGLFLSAMVGLVIYVVAATGARLLWPRFAGLARFPKAAVLAALFFGAGVVAWFAVILPAELILVGSLHLSWLGVAASLAITGGVSVAVGGAFYAYETTRDRLEESVARLKEAEYAERELMLARELQARLLPPAALAGSGWRVAARNVPARWVAGDFYDVFPLPDGSMALAIGDVAGKGVAAGLITASVKAVLPLLAAEHDVAATLAALNTRLVAELGPREFVALSLARFDPAVGRLQLANAGLPDAYLLRPGEPPSTLPVPGPRLPLGVRADVEYASREVDLAPSDRVLLVTDGLPEARMVDGEPLGYEEFLALLPEIDGHSPEEWLDALLGRLGDRVSEPADDLTALLLERTSATL